MAARFSLGAGQGIFLIHRHLGTACGAIIVQEKEIRNKYV